ncbi:Ras-related protein Rab-6.1 [Tritrichomonas foetus]|uniref:Ras-related protein Rab-6.1 n=1 Tax=Tritrichomonas foetus TaxID=1144522 RepID=A0A1J4KAP9_9EUKA|nr:Ras-related protein Rab-6.1 [Tritrichomonas foetus]|eukprot:OHT06525.1 Ras-related protein Rab-6.1 [Tritrichomonas foetus]
MSQNQAFKVVFIGETSVGKTSIITRALQYEISDEYKPTVGGNYFLKNVNHNGQDIRLNLWDTAGQERFRSMIPIYFRDANAIIIVYDISNRESFTQCDYWIDQMNDVENKILKFFVGNKIDLENERVVSVDEGRNKAEHYNAAYFEVSAKSGNGIEELFELIGERCISDDLNPNAPNLDINDKLGLGSCC